MEGEVPLRDPQELRRDQERDRSHHESSRSRDDSSRSRREDRPRRDRDEHHDRDRRSSRHHRSSRSPSRRSSREDDRSSRRERRKKSNWDVAPDYDTYSKAFTGAAVSAIAATVSGQPLMNPVAYGALGMVPNPLVPPAAPTAPPPPPKEPKEPSASQSAHQVKQQKRLYIGNIPTDVSEQEMLDLFNKAMTEARLTENPTPVLAVQVNYEKSFAFIEFDNIEDPTACLKLDGLPVRGYHLKVRRPKDYVPPPSEKDPNDEDAELKPSTLKNVVSTVVEEGPNKIFIGGLPGYLNEEGVKELLSTFGELKSFNLVKDSNTGNSKGYAFFEFLDPSLTDVACQNLNGMKVGEKTVVAQRASVGRQKKQEEAEQTPVSEQQSCLHNITALSFLNLEVPLPTICALLGMNIADFGEPTRILMILNAVDREDLRNDRDYQETLQDVREECEQYGSVLNVVIPRPINTTNRPKTNKEPLDNFDVELNKNEPKVWGVGKIFVEFSRRKESKRALVSLASRRFNGRQVITGFFDEERYEKRNFEPDVDEELLYSQEYERIQKEEQEKYIKSLAMQGLIQPSGDDANKNNNIKNENTPIPNRHQPAPPIPQPKE